MISTIKDEILIYLEGVFLSRYLICLCDFPTPANLYRQERKKPSLFQMKSFSIFQQCLTSIKCAQTRIIAKGFSVNPVLRNRATTPSRKIPFIYTLCTDLEPKSTKYYYLGLSKHGTFWNQIQYIVYVLIVVNGYYIVYSILLLLVMQSKVLLVSGHSVNTSCRNCYVQMSLKYLPILLSETLPPETLLLDYHTK